MYTIILPKIEPNTEEATIVEWLKKEGDLVKKGEALFVIETSKAAIEVEAEETGTLRKIMVPEGKTVPVLSVLGVLGSKEEPLPDLSSFSALPTKHKPELTEQIPKKMEGQEPAPFPKASPAAKRVAREQKIELHQIPATGPGGRIVESDVWDYLKANKGTGKNNQKDRVLIIGAGRGGEVVADILQQNGLVVVGFLDDNETLWGKELLGKKIYGGLGLVDRLLSEKMFDSVIVSITSNMKLRKIIYERMALKSINFVNVIHPKADINSSVELGKGNIIGAFAYIGYGTRVGNNNLITAHSNIEHHNILGSHILFGPGVMTSGNVTIHDECSLGAGVNIEPHVTIGNNVAIASGSTVIYDLPPHTVLKSEVKR
ncbi:E3 binding domain-containing protein [Candidatus Woesearchaeota archaeon]|nr:E3 binding domain-containing protein [Candidatus Woesearchaeota archaeon]